MSVSQDTWSGYGPPAPAPAPSRRRVAVAVAAAVGALAGAGLVAFGVGALLMLSARTQEGLAALGVALFALLAAAVAGVIAYVSLLAGAALRFLPKGRRVTAVTAAVAVPVMLVVLAAVIPSLTGHPRWNATSNAAGVCGLLCAPAAFAWAASGRRVRALAWGVGAAVLVVAVFAAAGVVVDRSRVERAAAGLPLVVFPAGQVDQPFPGWRRDAFSTTHITAAQVPFGQGRQAYVKYFAPGGVVFVTMHTGVGPCVGSGHYLCQDDGPVPGGRLRTYTRLDGQGVYYPQSVKFDVLVYADGSAVSVSDPAAQVAPGTVRPDAREALLQLRRVDAATFERVTGSALRVG